VYTLVLTKEANKFLNKINPQDKTAILTKLHNLATDPFAPNKNIKPLKGHDRLYRLRVGDYRIIYHIHNQELKIQVVKVGHRKDVYTLITQ